VDELLDEVGPDVARFFFLTRKADSQLEFDLALATKESQENPVFYVQYANARLASIKGKALEKGIVMQDLDQAPLHRLELPGEIGLLKVLDGFPEVVERAALELEPHRIIFYLIDLAGQFHSYYNQHKVISDDPELTQARLWLAEGLRPAGCGVVGPGQHVRCKRSQDMTSALLSACPHTDV
jgi:arginyl-tRNA synthetase